MTPPGSAHRELKGLRVMKKLSLASVFAVLVTPVFAETSFLRSLPSEVQKNIEETRVACKEVGKDVTSGDEGFQTFKLGGKQALLIDQSLLCGGCSAGINCSNRGARDVEVYVLQGGRWSKVLSDHNITGDIFISRKPGRREEFNALVVTLYIGNKECPTRMMPSASEQSWEARDCVVRWNGSKFTYKPL
jgi:hypothetical protein